MHSQIMQDTSFETLESLADFTVTQLQKRLLNQMLPGSQVQLRLEKPRAIAFADAPAVEVFRTTPGGKRTTRSQAPAQIQMHQRQGTLATIASVEDVGSPSSAGQARLTILRPYA